METSFSEFILLSISIYSILEIIQLGISRILLQMFSALSLLLQLSEIVYNFYEKFRISENMFDQNLQKSNIDQYLNPCLSLFAWFMKIFRRAHC